jgi:co-chaperonin GroES (HSP10)
MKMPRIVPLRDDVVVHPIGQSDKMGSIHIPNSYKRKMNAGIIVALGPDVDTEWLQVGDHVGFPARAGNQLSKSENEDLGFQITLENGQFYILPENAILCKYEPSNVRLIDTETVKRLISERFTELRASYKGSFDQVMDELKPIEEALLDRIDSLIVAEAFEI